MSATATTAAAPVRGVGALRGSPGAFRLLAISLLARVPLAALGVVLLVHVRDLTGGYAHAGVVTGVYAIAFAASSPVLGSMIDHRTQPPVLTGAAVVGALALLAIAALPAGAGLAILAALAALAGAATPPLGPALRVLWPRILAGPERVHAAYALESGLLELAYIVGPSLLLALAAVSSRAALAAGGLLMLAGTAAFAAQPAPRAWRGAGGPRRMPGSALRAPGLRTLVGGTLLVGALLGAVEVAVAASAAEAGHGGVTGVLLGLWGAGSLAGGLLAAHRGPSADPSRGLVLLLAGLTAAHVPLALAGSRVAVLAVLLVAAGVVVAPVFAAMNGMIDAVAPPGTATEAFAWLTTSVGGGIAVGAPLAGLVADAAGPPAAFLTAAGCGLTAALVVVLGRHRLPRRAPA